MENLEVTHTGAIIEGSEHVAIEYAAGGDIYITENNSSGFADINSESYSDEYYIPPVFSGAVVEQVKDRKLIVLSGGAGFDKNEFARHVASRVAADLNGIPVSEWRDNEDAEEIIQEITEQENSRVFIIPDAVPQHVGYDITRLVSLARQRGHCIILTTDMTEVTWQQQEAIIRLYWFNVPATGLYTTTSLGIYLLQRLNGMKYTFAIPVDVTIDASTPLTGTITAAGLSGNFETPREIDFFLMLLEDSGNNDPLEQKIKSALHAIKDKSETLVTKWYRSLGAGERLIALGAALLDGLYDDQFFAVMQQVANDFWHHRYKSLQSLDYCDLDFLMNFFSFETFGDGRQTLVCKFPGQRAEIIRAAWQSHKRHILSAFTIITTLAGSSSAQSAGKNRHAEINGTKERGKRLRAVAAETISDIGIVSLQTAEPKLLELAASSDITTRRITAKAMARWRAFDKEEQMYTTLAKWQKSASNNVRSTVVFTLKYAAEYDGPGHLDPRIMGILNEMSGDAGVITTMKDILPVLIQNHALIIQQDLRDYFAVEEAYSDLLAEQLAGLYVSHPVQIKEWLEDWLNCCMEESSQLNRRQAFTYRDNRLIVILKVYRSLPYGKDTDTISLGYVWGLIDRLHHHEQRVAMRAFIMETAAFLISVNPEDAIRHIEPVFRKLGTEGRFTLIRSITTVYLQQRAALQNGEYLISVHGFSIPVWYTSRRPATAIEMVLYRWLTGTQQFAREVATLAFVEFAMILDQAEPGLIQQAIQAAAAEKYERERRQTMQEQQRRMEARVDFPVMPELSLWSRIKIFFWLLFRTDEEKMVLKEIMRTVLMYKRADPTYLWAVMQRWAVQPDERIQRMSWWLGKLIGM